MEKHFEFKEINTRLILSDQTYQRPVNPVRVAQIVKNFDPNLANPPKLSFRDGRYYVYDGGHTIAAWKAKNGGRDLPVLCKVTYGLTRLDEAILFEKQNGISARVEINHLHRSMLNRGDESVVGMVRIAESHGFNVDFAKNVARNRIIGTASLLKAYKQLGPAAYSDFLSILRAVWDGDADSLRKEVIEGLSIFRAQYDGQYNRATLIKKLRAVPPIEIIREGRVSRAGGGKKYAQVIVNIYNKCAQKRLADVK